METTTISGCPNASTPLTGSERIVMDQGGLTVDASAQDVADLAPAPPGTDLGYEPATRALSSSTGADVVLPLATDGQPGLMDAADKARIDQLGENDSPTFAGGIYTGLLSVLTPTASSNTNVASTTAWVRSYVTSLGYGAGSVVGVTGIAPIAVTPSATTPQVSISAATPSSAGSMSATDKAKLDSITLDTATTVLKRVKNVTGGTLARGTPVYVVGSSGTEMVVAPADASVEATAAQTLGLVQADIPDNDTGYVMAVGLLTGLNTASLAEGQLVWLSETTGQYTSTRPTQPAHGVILGYCVKSAPGAAGSLYVKVDNGYELGELHDVLLSGSVTGDVLSLYADGLWKGRTLGSASLLSAGTSAGDVVVLDSGAKVPSALLPGYVDDVLEYASYAAFPATGEAGKLYVSLATNRQYRWSGSIYVEINPSPGSTDAVPEGSVNLYFTSLRGQSAAGAWWQGYSSSVGRSVATAVDADAARTALGAGTSSVAISASAAQALGATAAAGSTGQAADAGHVHQFQGTDICIPLTGESSNISAAVLLTVGYWPRATVLTTIPIWMLNTAPTGAAAQFDIRVGGTSIFATLPTIDATKSNSPTSATQAVFSAAFISGGQAIAQGASVTIHCTQIGSTVAGAGLKVVLPSRRNA